jgi:hypothetical protein
MRARLIPVAAALAVMVAFYLIPNLVESRLIGVVPPLALIVAGDAVGCLALSRLSLRAAVGTYGVLTSAESLLYYSGVLSLERLVWVSDLVPAAMLAPYPASQLRMTSSGASPGCCPTKAPSRKIAKFGMACTR